MDAEFWKGGLGLLQRFGEFVLLRVNFFNIIMKDFIIFIILLGSATGEPYLKANLLSGQLATIYSDDHKLKILLGKCVL